MGKLLFIQSKDTQLLGPMYISAQAKKLGHQVELVLDEEGYLDKIQEFSPDLIGFSIMTVDVEWMLKTLNKLRNSGINTRTIVGGAHAILFPEVIEHPFIDFVCYTEGEDIIPVLLDCITCNRTLDGIPGIWWKDNNGQIIKNERSVLKDDLDAYLFPDREIYKDIRKNKEVTARVLASRGCTCQCSFCEMPAIIKENRGYGKPYRLRSRENIIEEIKTLQATGIKYIVFTDSTLNLNTRWFKELLELYAKEVGIPFSCNIRIDLLDEEAGLLLHKANCQDVRIGVETGNEELRKRVLHKEISNEKLFRGTEILKKYQIKVITYNMFCLPDETLAISWETIRLNRIIKPFVACTMIYMPFIKTHLYDYSIEKGYLKPGLLESNKSLSAYRSVLTLKDAKKISNLHKLSLLAIRHPALDSLIKILIHFPENKIFDSIYIISERLEMRHWKKESFLKTLKDSLEQIRYSLFYSKRNE